MPETPTYYERTWNDLPQFCCLLCGYDAWSLTQLEIHMGFLHTGLPLIKEDEALLGTHDLALHSGTDAFPPVQEAEGLPAQTLTEASPDASVQAEGI
jgi:hypothetical protein